ncbi:MAG: transglutaminase domain-containing protein [Lachnospiraceae bacterium]|nr:transglutaminase domain-containing protein [Lachnospiraceae bacterium]
MSMKKAPETSTVRKEASRKTHWIFKTILNPWIWLAVILVALLKFSMPTIDAFMYKISVKDPKTEPVTEFCASRRGELAERSLPGLVVPSSLSRYRIFLYVDSFRDHVAPVFEGLEDRMFTVGENVMYKEGVKAIDDRDGELHITVDNSQVDVNTEGTYPVTYYAEDLSGNSVEQTVYFTFVIPDRDLSDLEWGGNEEAEEPYSVDELPVLIERLYSSLCTEDMSPREKALQIYNWVFDGISYSGYAYTYDSFELEAVAGLHRRSGDCFTYTSITMALLNRAGIDNIVVRKIPMEGRSNHFWLMVYIEDAWWHYDTTPRAAGGLFFMLTDQEMLEYSEQHNDCFDFNLYDYPRTPGLIPERFLVNYPDLLEEYYGS